jgi:hypothetical protein
MANVLTNLAGDIFRAADIVGREQVGFIPSVTINSTESVRAAKGDTIRSAYTRQAVVAESYNPSMALPEPTYQTVDSKTFSINNYAEVDIPFTGEDIQHLRNGAGFETVYGDQIAQAMRSITNKIEQYIGVTAKNGANRAFGTAATTPFGSNFNEVAELRKIMVDSGMPLDGRATLVINSTAGVKLRNLAQLQKANEAGGSQLLRQGELLDLQGLMFKESAGVAAHTKGTGASYLVNNASGYAVGATTIAVDGGTGTVLAGDVVTFTGDTNKYVVATALAGGSLTLAGTGLRQTLANDVAMTVGDSYTGNIAFHQAAIELVCRPVAGRGVGQDAAIDSMTVQDPVSGLVYDVAVYAGNMMKNIKVSCLYDAKVWKPEFVATLLG